MISDYPWTIRFSLFQEERCRENVLDSGFLIGHQLGKPHFNIKECRLLLAPLSTAIPSDNEFNRKHVRGTYSKPEVDTPRDGEKQVPNSPQ